MKMLLCGKAGPAAWAGLLCLVLGQGCASPHAGNRPVDFDWGFIASRHKLPGGDTRLRAIGPLYERTVSAAGQEFKAIRPLYNRTEDPRDEKLLQEIFWPFAVTRQFKEKHSWRAGIFYGLNDDVNDPESKRHLWLFPFYFSGIDRHGESYHALFPVAGSIHEFLGRDRFSFCFWPLYVGTTLNDIQSTSFAWPIYSRTTGDDIERFRVFPFYGFSRFREDYVKKFVLWPFWNSAEYLKEPYGDAFILFPLYGQSHYGDETVRWFLPPFFRFADGGKTELNHMPWPFIHQSRGEINKFYVWPFYGWKEIDGITRRFYLWPLGWNNDLDLPSEYVAREYLWPLWSSERKSVSAQAFDEAQIECTYRKFWPLVSYQREGEQSRLRSLELWPLRHTGGIERNLAPFWTFFTHTRNGNHTDTELLWGLYRRIELSDDYRYTSVFPLVDWSADDATGQSSWSLLKGLFGMRRERSAREWRFLYFIKWNTGMTDP